MSHTQWRWLGDVSGIGGMFLWGISKLYDINMEAAQ